MAICHPVQSFYVSSVRVLPMKKGLKVICIISGTVFLAIGVAGIFLPLVPTTPFLLLTAALYLRGSKRLYRRLVSHKVLGPYILNYREKKIIPLRAKVATLSIMWVSMIACILFFIPVVWGKVLLALVGAGVTVHIMSFKSGVS